MLNSKSHCSSNVSFESYGDTGIQLLNVSHIITVALLQFANQKIALAATSILSPFYCNATSLFRKIVIFRYNLLMIPVAFNHYPTLISLKKYSGPITYCLMKISRFYKVRSLLTIRSCLLLLDFQ